MFKIKKNLSLKWKHKLLFNLNIHAECFEVYVLLFKDYCFDRVYGELVTGFACRLARNKRNEVVQMIILYFEI